MVQKKGQVTIFLVVGIVILVSFAAILFFISDSEPEDRAVPLATSVPGQVTRYVEACLHDTVTGGVILASDRGGRIFPEDGEMLETDETFLFYAYRNGDVTLEKEQTEREIGLYTDLTLWECIQDFIPFEYQVEEIGDVQMVDGAPLIDTSTAEVKSHTEVLIGLETLTANLEYPLKITQGDDSIILDSFSVEIPAKLGEAVDVSQDIVEQYGDTKEYDLAYYADFDPFVKVFPIVEGQTVFTLYYGPEELPEYFIYALEDTR